MEIINPNSLPGDNARSCGSEALLPPILVEKAGVAALIVRLVPRFLYQTRVWNKQAEIKSVYVQERIPLLHNKNYNGL